MLADAETRAEQLGDSYVATEHLLIALAAVASDAQKVLRDLKVTADDLSRKFNELARQQAGDQRRGRGHLVRARPVRRGPDRAVPATASSTR